MNTVATGAALVAIVTTALIYGTDLFCALVLRPAAGGAADSSVADLLGRVHEYGDRRLPVPGAVSVLATALATATSDDGAARIGGAIALLALLAWLAIYTRIITSSSAPLLPATPSLRTPGPCSNVGIASSGPAPHYKPLRWPGCSRSS
jgi:hypothetical protein